MSAPTFEEQCLAYLKEEAKLDPSLVECRVDGEDVLVIPVKWIPGEVWAEVMDYSEAMNGGWEVIAERRCWTFDVQLFKDRLEDKKQMADIEWLTSTYTQEQIIAMHPPNWSTLSREEKVKLIAGWRAEAHLPHLRR